MPGTIEHALNHLLDREIDLSGFDQRFKNDLVSASVRSCTGVALGTRKRQAIVTAIGSKSYRHLSRTLATPMTNDWLQAQGLVSAGGLWMKAQGYA